MKIKKISADSFGKLKKTQIDLDPGINVVVGANESGKSSITRFIRFMLYGFGNARTDPDKTKYIPWNEESCKGELEIETESGDFTVRREQAARASHSISDADGVPVFKGICAGEAFLGVNGEAFDKTALVSAGDVFFKDTLSLSSAIKNMVFSADSAVDSDDALKKLEKLSASILGKAERSGSLYEARKELSELVSRKVEVAEMHRELLSAQSRLDKTTANIASNNEIIKRLEAERANIEAYEALKLCEKIDGVRSKAEESRKAYEEKSIQMSADGFVPDREYLSELNETVNRLAADDVKTEAARKELAFAEQALKSGYGNEKQLKFNKTLEEAEVTPEELSENIEVLKKNTKNSRLIAIILTVLIVTIPVAVFFWVRFSKIRKQLEKLAAKFACTELSELEYMLSNSRASADAARLAEKRYTEAKEALDSAVLERGNTARLLCGLLDKGGCKKSISDTSDIADTAREFIKLISADISVLEALESKYKVDEAALESMLSSVSEPELREKAGQYTESIPLRELNKNAVELDFHIRANEGLKNKERELEKLTTVIASGMEKPDELAAKIELISKRIDEMELKHAALNMASDAIRTAHEKISGDVSPVLTEKASQLFSEMTGGKYKGLYVDSELKLSFLENGSAEYRNVEYLSSGALDAAYLALRITLSEHLYNEKPMLIFDDAFSRFDDGRLGMVCEMLKRISEEYQIIVLSCHEREAELLGGNVIRI